MRQTESPPDTLKLRELQQDMQRHLLGEESAVTTAIVDAPPLSAADRLAIYRNAYQVRLIDALHETHGVEHIDMPCTPARVWAAMQGRPEPPQ